MKKTPPSVDPDAYVAGLEGWRRACVEHLRTFVAGVPQLEEAIKWGHLVYSKNGPVLLIRAEADRVLFGFWRGRRLRAIDARLKPGGRYEMATITLREGDTVAAPVARRLVKQAVALNEELGDPRLAAGTR